MPDNKENKTPVPNPRHFDDLMSEIQLELSSFWAGLRAKYLGDEEKLSVLDLVIEDIEGDDNDESQPSDYWYHERDAFNREFRPGLEEDGDEWIKEEE